jgi:type II secretory pathway pseudopilin PulG
LVRRSAFTILELLVVVGIMGMLMAIILPAVGSAREAARRTQCISQMRQIGIALHSYHEISGCLPPGCQWEWTRQSAYGWNVPLLPFLEQSATYQRLDRNRSLFDPVNEGSREAPMGLLVCPSDIADSTFMFYHDDSTATPGAPLFRVSTASYVGVFGSVEPDEDPDPLNVPGDGAFIDGRSLRFADFQRGLSNTLFVGERTMERVPSTWVGFDIRADDGLCRLVGMAQTTPNCEPCDECEFSSRHHGGAMFLWGDGRVRMISENVDSAEYQRFARRSSN